MAIPIRLSNDNLLFFFVVALYLVAMRILGIVDSEFGARGNPLGVSIYIAAPLPAVKKNPFVLVNCIFLIAISGTMCKKVLCQGTILSISPVASFCILALVVSTVNVAMLNVERQYTSYHLTLDWVKVAAIARNASNQRVLVAQTAGLSNYSALLDATRPANEAYALRNGYDYIAARGIFFGTKESHATFNKAFLLELALARHEHDVLLSLDADAMVVDSLFAPAALLPNGTLLAASRGASNEPHTWDVNAGVLVWNLRHPRAQEVSAAWAAGCRDAVMRGENDDQTVLHGVLRALGPEACRSLLNTFVGDDAGRINYDGVHVKHFMRADALDWTGDSVPARLTQIGETARRLSLPTQPPP
jgi:hypothetical protein